MIIKQKIVIIILAIVFVFSILPLIYRKAHALLGVSDPFGGMILSTIFCPASVNTWIIVGPPVPGSFTYDPGTIIYMNFKPFTGSWVLGLADAFEPCVIFVPSPVGPLPVPIGGGERIRIMGTS